MQARDHDTKKKTHGTALLMSPASACRVRSVNSRAAFALASSCVPPCFLSACSRAALGAARSTMWRIPLSDLNYGPEEERAVLDVLRSRWLTMGPRTEEFEARFAEHTGARHAVAVANCTCGLELVYAWAMCRAADIHGAGPEPFGFVVPDITDRKSVV